MNSGIRVDLLRACRRVSLCPLVVLLIWTRKGRDFLWKRLGDDDYPIGFSRYDSFGSILSIVIYWAAFYAIQVQTMLTVTGVCKWTAAAVFTLMSVPMLVAGIDLFYDDKVDSDYALTGTGTAKNILMLFAIIGAIVALPMMILYIILVMFELTVLGPIVKYGDGILKATAVFGFVSGIGLMFYGLGCYVPVVAVIGVYVVIATLLCLFCAIPIISRIIDKFDIFGDGSIDLFE